MLLVRKGKSEAVWSKLNIPMCAVVRDLEGKFIYPSFIDLYSSYGLPDSPERNRRWDAPPQFLSGKQGAYAWNEAIRAEYEASAHFSANSEAAGKLRELGFGAVLSHQKDGIARGTSVLVTLGDDRDHLEIVREQAAAHYSFNKGSSANDYPTSLMGAIALLRQSWYDATWYAAGGKEKARNLTLEALNAVRKLPQFFEAADVLDIQRADRVGDEFGMQFIFKARGDAYQRLELVKATGGALVVPLNFPEAFDMEDAWDARQVSLAAMKHWELAPYNPARVEDSGLRVALTADEI